MNLFSCHEVKEILPGLIIGGIDNLREMLDLGADVLVSLAGVPESLRESDWQGELMVQHIDDGGTLSFERINKLLEEIVAHLKSGRRVGIFCIGGHGRTGYVAACVLCRLDIDNPIAFLRKNYCIKAVETEEQINAIMEYVQDYRESGLT